MCVCVCVCVCVWGGGKNPDCIEGITVLKKSTLCVPGENFYKKQGRQATKLSTGSASKTSDQL